MAFLAKIFGDANKRIVEKLQSEIARLSEREPELQKLSDSDIIAKTEELKAALANGKSPDDIMPEAFALVREASRRRTGMRHFDVQLIGGLVLHRGKIAEMRTGEGKTLVATLALYLNALAGKGAHLVTVNDYLARRDTVWMGLIYHALGMKVGCIQHEAAFLFDPEFKAEQESYNFLRPVTRKEAYQADITYGTNNEFGFDYLRDNMAGRKEDKVQRPLYYAIVDEVDSILIDEARTPLIISSPAEESTDLYYKFAKLIPQLKENEDFNIDEKMRSATLTDAGVVKMEQWLGLDNLYVIGGLELIHHIEQALRAQTLYKKDKDYVVKDGEVIIVDEFTGRLMPGRRYSEGLHQAIEAKEGVKIQQESRTMATITFQNYFRMYKKLAGMTGTAATEAEEFSKIYTLDVVIVPTNKDMIRKDQNDLIYKNEQAKYQAVMEDIKNNQAQGRPVLVGTISIEKNEILSELLERNGVPHQVLNAKQHEKEAKIITQAGRLGAVTIATNMAGRGVDIVLGGNPPEPGEAKKVRELGGLYVIGTERHESRRIDNQLRGRSGRQGDPGASRFFVSLEDDLMRIFGSDRLKSVMERLGVPDDMPIENRMISSSIESAQKKVEGYNFDIRKRLVEFDDVINKHREVIYKKRDDILEAAEHEGALREKIREMVNAEVEQVISFHTADENSQNWNLKEVSEVLNTIFPSRPDILKRLQEIVESARDKLHLAQVRTEIINYCNDLAHETIQQMEQRVNNPQLMHEIRRGVLLRSIDLLWVEHLEQMDYLRKGIGLRGYGQRDPLIEYKKEAYDMFSQLISSIQNQVVHTIFKIGQVKQENAPETTAPVIEMGPSKTMEEGRGQFQQIQAPPPGEKGGSENDDATITKPGPIPGTIIKAGRLRMKDGTKIGRNDPCPCGSGKKFKKCHGK